jgi:hypothetical protein
LAAGVAVKLLSIECHPNLTERKEVKEMKATLKALRHALAALSAVGFGTAQN